MAGLIYNCTLKRKVSPVFFFIGNLILNNPCRIQEVLLLKMILEEDRNFATYMYMYIDGNELLEGALIGESFFSFFFFCIYKYLRVSFMVLVVIPVLILYVNNTIPPDCSYLLDGWSRPKFGQALSS